MVAFIQLFSYTQGVANRATAKLIHTIPRMWLWFVTMETAQHFFHHLALVNSTIELTRQGCEPPPPETPVGNRPWLETSEVVFQA